jgi:hypothetical protein
LDISGTLSLGFNNHWLAEYSCSSTWFLIHRHNANSSGVEQKAVFGCSETPESQQDSAAKKFAKSAKSRLTKKPTVQFKYALLAGARQ